jgi:RNA polymerase sigma-70 factor (ECF subfamily)
VSWDGALFMPVPEFDMAGCLARVRRHDAAAARALVEHLTPLVSRIVGSHLPRRLAAEDLCQDVFVKVFAKLDQYHGAVPFEHWVARVALNTCRDHLRGEQRNREIRWSDLDEAEAAVLENSAAAEPGLDAGETVAARELVHKLLAALSPEDRLVITLIDLEQRTAGEVRQVTGWSITGIRVRTFRARRRLQKQLARLLAGRPS